MTKRTLWFFLVLALVACQPGAQQSTTLNVIDGEKVVSLQPKSQAAASIVAEAGFTLTPADKIYYNGFELPTDYNLPVGANGVLQIRHPQQVTLITPDGRSTFETTAQSIGQAVSENGLTLYANDFLSPPAQTPLNAPVTITYRPARELTISLGETALTVKSSAKTVGQALTDAGIPLLGLDESIPAESKPLPADGKIKIVRVAETFSLQQKPVPFETEYQPTDELDLDAQNILQPGVLGLAVTRIRVRMEDGEEVDSQNEAETIVQPPVSEVIGTGTKITLRNVPGSNPPLQYWRAVSMYATWYSPCHSGTSTCHYGTASGMPVRRGVVGMIRANYNAMAGQQLYIPGYGKAVVGDIGAGTSQGPWIDLAYADDDPGDRLQGWVLVYFLTPVPPNVLYVIQ
jgi:uncharacterized protein YabE (DUF348 family)